MAHGPHFNTALDFFCSAAALFSLTAGEQKGDSSKLSYLSRKEGHSPRSTQLLRNGYTLAPLFAVVPVVPPACVL